MNVISCSRRTDIPRCYPDWLSECLATGAVEYRSPRGGLHQVSLRPDDVHSIVLWSKDYGHLIENRVLSRQLSQLNPFFHFTVTGLGGSPWEREIPAWEQAANQMRSLAKAFGAARVNWRFDPIVHWIDGGVAQSNLSQFEEIATVIAETGVKTCSFSFTQWYQKSRRRSLRAGLPFVDLSAEEKMEAVAALSKTADCLGFELCSCACERWTAVAGVGRGRCVDAARLDRLRGDGAAAPAAKDATQRTECACTKSVDIGSYTQRCPGEACVYCYAN